MNKIGVLTSGGDSPGMNAAIRAVVRCGIEAGFEVWGIERGYEGLLDGELRQMDRSSVGDILHRGGTILKTARSERFMEACWIDKAAEMLATFGIGGLVGAQRTELVESIFGIRAIASGEIWKDGEKLNIKSVRDAKSHGIALLTE